MISYFDRRLKDEVKWNVSVMIEVDFLVHLGSVWCRSKHSKLIFKL